MCIVLTVDSSSVTSAPVEDDQYVDDQDSMYFGLKEYCDSIKWTHQFPLFRQDDAFERMALRTTRSVLFTFTSVYQLKLSYKGPMKIVFTAVL